MSFAQPNKRISIHAPRTGSDATNVRPDLLRNISIHAPRTGSDGTSQASALCPRISIHAPRTGSDDHVEILRAYTDKFQSTLPARGATMWQKDAQGAWVFQSTLPARGATVMETQEFQTMAISIHAPRTGSDVHRVCGRRWQHPFQSTLPARGATQSPRAAVESACHFNPRSPHGERR